MTGRRIASWALAAGLCWGATAPASADDFDAVRATIRAHMQQHNVPGLAAAVWKDGRIVWAEGFGWADMENRVPADAHTPFNIASLSKTLTATGVMTLVEAGKVDLDGPINDYLGPDTISSRVGTTAGATVRRVANHTSGLPASEQRFYGEEAVNVPTMAENIRRYGMLVTPTGERFRYSNIGYGILGHLVAQVSGKSFTDYMRSEVFLPLGMTRSSVYIAPGLEAQAAVRYDFDRRPIPFWDSAEPGSTLMYASAHDLARFGMFFLKNRLPDQRPILRDASIDEMMRDPANEQSSPVRVAKAGEPGYSVGWIHSTAGGYATLGHSGSSSGVNSSFLLLPSENLGVVVVANADGGASGIAGALLRHMLPQWRDVAPRKAEARPAVAEALPAALHGTWEGQVHTHEGPRPITLQVRDSGDVHIRIGGEPRFPGRATLLQPALVNRVSFEDGTLRGLTLAQLPTSDTTRYPHNVSLDLKLRGDVLNGVVSAASVFDGYWRFHLPYWTELRRSPTD